MSEWDEYAEGWDADEAARAYSRGAFASLVSAASKRGMQLDGLHICDFGCGTGLLAEQLADRVGAIDAVDTSPAMLAVLARKIVERGWTNIRTMAKPVASAAYDLIVCSSVCAFVEDYPATAKRLAATLGPGGLFVQWDWELDPTAEQPHGLSRDTIQRALEGAGLTNISVEVGFEVAFGERVMAPLMAVGRMPG